MDILMFMLAVLIILVPSMIAFYRKLDRKWACLIVNVLVGWTIVLWVPLWMWSMLTSEVEKPTVPPVA